MSPDFDRRGFLRTATPAAAVPLTASLAPGRAVAAATPPTALGLATLTTSATASATASLEPFALKDVTLSEGLPARQGLGSM